jgi:hypothetical protein
MRAVNQYAVKNGFDTQNNFAAACYEQNSVEELAAVVIIVKNHNLTAEQVADAGDMATWGITAEQWLDGIRAALADKESDLT